MQGVCATTAFTFSKQKESERIKLYHPKFNTGAMEVGSPSSVHITTAYLSSYVTVRDDGNYGVTEELFILLHDSENTPAVT